MFSRARWARALPLPALLVTLAAVAILLKPFKIQFAGPKDDSTRLVDGASFSSTPPMSDLERDSRAIFHRLIRNLCDVPTPLARRENPADAAGWAEVEVVASEPALPGSRPVWLDSDSVLPMSGWLDSINRPWSFIDALGERVEFRFNRIAFGHIVEQGFWTRAGVERHQAPSRLRLVDASTPDVGPPAATDFPPGSLAARVRWVPIREADRANHHVRSEAGKPPMGLASLSLISRGPAGWLFGRFVHEDFSEGVGCPGGDPPSSLAEFSAVARPAALSSAVSGFQTSTGLAIEGDVVEVRPRERYRTVAVDFLAWEDGRAVEFEDDDPSETSPPPACRSCHSPKRGEGRVMFRQREATGRRRRGHGDHAPTVTPTPPSTTLAALDVFLSIPRRLQTEPLSPPRREAAPAP